jgi:hypothetical protein
VGGVLVLPTFEEIGTHAAAVAEAAEEIVSDGLLASEADVSSPTAQGGGDKRRQKSTRHLIERAVQRLMRAGGRKNEADGAHLLEGISVIAYDPNTGLIDPDLPPPGSGLRWGEFVEALAAAYEARFER